MPRVSGSVRDRFREKYVPEPNTGCWLWLDSLTRKGYGKFGRTSQRAHRVSWELTFGPIPSGLHVLHKCDTPSCVNPSHLMLGTNDDNVADKVAKHRQVRGEKQGLAKLTVAEIKAIRQSAESNTVLGEIYGVTRQNIIAIKKGLTWKHVTGT